ncbi:MAG TPA: hypothetical protein VD995_12830 [Azospirillum sp.]|nr:hypothetical protein [Azospirillum sp.]
MILGTLIGLALGFALLLALWFVLVVLRRIVGGAAVFVVCGLVLVGVHLIDTYVGADALMALLYIMAGYRPT